MGLKPGFMGAGVAKEALSGSMEGPTRRLDGDLKESCEESLKKSWDRRAWIRDVHRGF